jgi:hypothetical protein
MPLAKKHSTRMRRFRNTKLANKISITKFFCTLQRKNLRDFLNFVSFKLIKIFNYWGVP